MDTNLLFAQLYCCLRNDDLIYVIKEVGTDQIGSMSGHNYVVVVPNEGQIVGAICDQSGNLQYLLWK